MSFPRGQGIKFVYLIGLAALFSIVAESAPFGSRRGLADGGVTVFDVTKHGATPDGETEDNSVAFIRAWNAACRSTGPVKLLVPNETFAAGEILFQGPCNASRPITIEIQGTLLAEKDLSAYPFGIWITISKIDGIVLTGGGTLNGRGESSWKYKSADRSDKGDNGGTSNLLPISLEWQNVNNSFMQNINLVDSKGFHMRVTDSSNINITDLHITAPEHSPNTDGIHISDSQNITVSNSVIGTGDDCISIGDGNTGVSISKIVCGPGHGISIGSLGKREQETDVKGITVTNCTLTRTTNGARIKTYRDSIPLQASNIIYDDIIMNEVKNPIIIDQHYSSKDRLQPSKVKITDVHFKNIRGTTVSKVPVALNCSEAVPCEGIELADIDLTPASGDVGPLSSQCTNAKLSIKGKFNPTGCS